MKNSLWSKSFIDLQNDVTIKDLKQAIKEGFDRIEHLKRFTTNSMGTDQGKISSINSLGDGIQNFEKDFRRNNYL